MAFSIIILGLSSILLLGFALRSRYGLPLFLMTAGLCIATVAVLIQIYSTSTYSPPGTFPFRALEVSLFRYIGGNRFSAGRVQWIRNAGCFFYFAGIFLLNLLIIRNLKHKGRRRFWTAVTGLAWLAFAAAFLLYYSPANAFRIYLDYYARSAQEQAGYRLWMHRLDIGFRCLVLLMILSPILMLSGAYARHMVTYFADTAVLLGGMAATYDALFFAMFFTGPFAERMDTVFRSGFWFFSGAVRIPAWISWFYPLFSLILLGFVLLNTNRVFSGELVLLFRKRALKRSIEDLNRNLKDVLHSEKNLMFSIQLLSNEAKAAYGTPEGLEKLERLSDLVKSRMENITSSLNRIRELHLKARPVDMRMLMDEALDSLPLPEEIVCEKHYSSFPTRCVIDEYHTRSALKNIFANSLDALMLSPEDDRRITVTVDASQEWVSLSIRDNGPGIPQSELRRIMLPFVSTKSKNANWGIGLPYVFRIVNAQLGQMRISSSDRPEQHYTQVEILLPRERRND